MPDLTDEAINTLLKEIKAKPELLSLTTTELLEEFPSLHTTYSLHEPNEYLAFKKFWNVLKRKFLRDNHYNSSDAVAPPAAATAPPPSISPNVMPHHMAYYSPYPLPTYPPQQLIRQTIIHNNNNINNNNTTYNDKDDNSTHNEKVDQDKLIDGIVEGVTQSIDPKFSKLEEVVVANTSRKQPPSSAQRAEYSPSWFTDMVADGHGTPYVRKNLFHEDGVDDDSQHGENYFEGMFKKIINNESSGYTYVQQRRIEDVKEAVEKENYQFPKAVFQMPFDELCQKTNTVLVYQPVHDTHGAFVYVADSGSGDASDSDDDFDDDLDPDKGTGSIVQRVELGIQETKHQYFHRG